MISFIKDWANQIIIASIIATVIEMILPETNNKKYIKMLIGIYILFAVLNPIISKSTLNNTNDIFNLENHIKASNYKTKNNYTEKYEYNNSKLIENEYINTIKEDIKNKISEKGFEVLNISLNIEKDTKSNNYGKITNIDITINKSKNVDKKNNNNMITIDTVNIKTNENNTNEKNINNLNNIEKNDLIDFLSKEYSINKNNITLY